MATQTIDLTGEWTEVVSELNLAVGTDYNAVPADGPVEVRESASQAAPAAADRGRPLWPGSDRRAADSIDITPVAGEYVHVRALRGSAALVVDVSP